MTKRVLIIEDDAALRASIVQTLELEDLEPIATGSFIQARRSIRSNFNGVILSDIKMPDHDGFDVLHFAQGLDPDLPVVLLTGHSDVPTAMRAIREGAYDYLEKPCETNILVDTLRRALDHRALILRNRNLTRQLDRSDIAAQKFPGQSQATQNLRQALRENAEYGAPIHIWGETGAGKQIAADVIHSLSDEKSAFLAIDCATATLADLASLDLPHPLTLSFQNLHAAGPDLSDRISETLSKASVVQRITTAECRFTDLKLEWKTPEPVEIYVPSLAERGEDLHEIFEVCLRHAARAAQTDIPILPANTVQSVFDRDWPKNLIDLRNFAADLLKGSGDKEPATLSERIEEFEKSVIIDSLTAYEGRVAQVAKTLGIPRNTLYDRMARFGLVARDYRRK